MPAYYNEWEPNVAEWLRELIKEGVVAPGDVDTRDIREVKADDLRGYTQCHFFAGIGGWSVALRLAGWPDDRPVWTGSCPCQPFSLAGERAAQSDERHLWPDWYRLIRESKPATIFGEQVKSAITYGWLDDTFYDLEASDYACAAAAITACSVQAANEGERVYFVAKANSARLPAWHESGMFERQAEPQPRGELERILAKGNWREWETASGLRLLDDGVPKRMGAIKAYGNAIDPGLASHFIAATV